MHVISRIQKIVGLLLRVVRLRAGLDQDQLAQRLAVSQPTISRWETCFSMPSEQAAMRWLDSCGIPTEGGDDGHAQEIRLALARLLRHSGDKQATEVARYGEGVLAALVRSDQHPASEVPFFADVAAGVGEGQEALAGPRSYLEVPAGLLGRDPSCYAMRVRGDSMEPGLLDGDIVIISPASPPVDGCIVAAYIEPDGDVVKIYRELPDGGVLLQPANSEYPAIVLRNGSSRELRIWGRVIFQQREL